MPAHDRARQDALEPSAPNRPAPQEVQQGPLELAGQIGNSSMQRVAASPALQRSPGAAGLMRSPLARESEDTGPAPATPDAEVDVPAASPEAGIEKEDENVPETTGESGVEKQPEVPPAPVGPRGLGKESEGASEPGAGVSKEAGGEEKDQEATEAA
jgi:hypothetical protein